MGKVKWYKESTFKFSFIAIGGIGALITIGTSIVDEQFNPIGLIAGGVMLFTLTGLQYILRNNP